MLEEAHRTFVDNVRGLRLDDALDAAGGDRSILGSHWSYHAGEINEILAVRRGKAWEYGEEVEENHISTAGLGVRPGWMTADQAAQYELHDRRRARGPSTT